MQRCCPQCCHENIVPSRDAMMFGIKGNMLDALPHYTKDVPSFPG